jgi:hypothetical protein
VLTAPAFAVEPLREPLGRAPRIARLLALSHKLDAIVGSGEIRGYAQLARLGHISPARLTQIMVLLHLAPAIQELHSVSLPGRRTGHHRVGFGRCL